MSSKEQIQFGPYPDNQSAASAIARRVTEQDPKYQELMNEVKHFQEFTKGTRSASDERHLDNIRNQANELFHKIYQETIIEAQQIMSKVSTEVLTQQLILDDGKVDEEKTTKYWRAINAINIVKQRLLDPIKASQEELK